MLRKKFVSVSALALVSALAMAVPVHADHSGPPDPGQLNDDDSFGAASCAFTGVSGHAGPGVRNISADWDGNPGNATLGIPAGASDGGAVDPLDLLDTDGGKFTFDGSATCAGADAGGNTVGAVPPTTVALRAEGHFTNLICGTGQADGWATAVAGNVSLATRFGILFAGGHGKLDINHADGWVGLSGPGTIGPAGKQDIDNGNGNGYVNIKPTGNAADGNCVTTDVTSFSVTGAFGLVMSGNKDANNAPNT